MYDLCLIVCTYNNARLLRETLASVAAQRTGGGAAFDLVVVDNNCTDDTAALVDSFARDHNSIPTRLVRETRQGLTHARLCGLAHAPSEWIAYVDDDCILAPDWVEQALAFARRTPRCGALGGRVVVDCEGATPPYLKQFGWLMARQDYGDAPRRVDFLVGAGLMLRRAALVESGWPRRPLLGDRVGSRLASGGDVEIGLRIAARNWELWYVPACRLDHRIPERRTKEPYLRRLAFELGVSEVLVGGLGWNGSQAGFAGSAVRRAARRTLRALRRGLSAFLRGRDRRPARLDGAFAFGGWAGIWRLFRLPAARRSEIIGALRRTEETGE